MRHVAAHATEATRMLPAAPALPFGGEGVEAGGHWLGVGEPPGITGGGSKTPPQWTEQTCRRVRSPY